MPGERRPAPRDYVTLNRVRFKSLELLRLLEAARERRKEPAFQILVGGGLCLWRAAFMVDERLDFIGGAAGAMNVLEEVLSHNAWTYAQEKQATGWVAGFYLNSAETRVAAAGARLKVKAGENGDYDGVRWYAEEYLRGPEHPVKLEGVFADRWERAHSAAEWLVMKRLVARKGSTTRATLPDRSASPPYRRRRSR